MQVWNLETQRFVKLEEWMKWCPHLATKHIPDETWDNMEEARKEVYKAKEQARQMSGAQ